MLDFLKVADRSISRHFLFPVGHHLESGDTLEVVSLSPQAFKTLFLKLQSNRKICLIMVSHCFSG